MHLRIYIIFSTIGAVGSALVLCTDGPGFEPLMVHFIFQFCRISLVGQDSWLSPGRHGFDSRMRYEQFYYNHMTAAIAQLGERQTEDLKVPGSIPGGGNHIITSHHTLNLLCCSYEM